MIVQGYSQWQWLLPWSPVWGSGSHLCCIYPPCEGALWSAGHWSEKTNKHEPLSEKWCTNLLSNPQNFSCGRTSLAAKTFFLTKPSATLKLSSTRTESSEEIKAEWVNRYENISAGASDTTLKLEVRSKTWNLWCHTFQTVSQVAGWGGFTYFLIAWHIVGSELIIAA